MITSIEFKKAKQLESEIESTTNYIRGLESTYVMSPNIDMDFRKDLIKMLNESLEFKISELKLIINDEVLDGN